jgi:hypothetical protein
MKRLTLVAVVMLLAVAVAGIVVVAQEGDQAAAPQANPRFAVVHLAPFAADPDTAVDIEIDGSPFAAGVAYGASTTYTESVSGTYLVEVFPAGETTLIMSKTVTLLDDKDFTIVAIGGANGWDPQLIVLEDDKTPPAAGMAKVRSGHLAPFAAAEPDTLADVRLQDGTVIADDVAFGDIGAFLELAAGTYDFKITTPDGATTLIDPMPVTVNDGDVVSVFAAGDGTNQPLGAFALPKGQVGAFVDLAAALQVAHLAPFAADPGTAVDVKVDGATVLTNFEFAGSTGYLPLQADVDHLVEILPAGTSTVAISATVNLSHTKGYAAIATGGANGWDLGLVLLENDTPAPAAGSFKLRLGHLAPFAAAEPDTEADVRLQDGTPVLEGVTFGQIADYLELAAGTYDLKITTPGGATTLIDPLPVTLSDGGILSAFAIGDGTNQPTAVFALPAGKPGFILPDKYMLYLPFIARND